MEIEQNEHSHYINLIVIDKYELGLTGSFQAESIADYFSSIPNEYDALNDDDIKVPHFTQGDITRSILVKYGYS